MSLRNVIWHNLNNCFIFIIMSLIVMLLCVYMYYMFIPYLNVWQAMMFCAMCLFELIKKCLRSRIPRAGMHIEGSQPEWCISSMIYSRDTPFWSNTLDIQLASQQAHQQWPSLADSYQNHNGVKVEATAVTRRNDWKRGCNTCAASFVRPMRV